MLRHTRNLCSLRREFGFVILKSYLSGNGGTWLPDVILHCGKVQERSLLQSSQERYKRLKVTYLSDCSIDLSFAWQLHFTCQRLSCKQVGFLYYPVHYQCRSCWVFGCLGLCKHSSLISSSSQTEDEPCRCRNSSKCCHISQNQSSMELVFRSGSVSNITICSKGAEVWSIFRYLICLTECHHFCHSMVSVEYH